MMQLKPAGAQLIASSRIGAVGLLVFGLAACGNGYQAPVSEQGEQLVITPPLIVNSSTPDSALRAATPSRRVATSSPATPSRSAATATSRGSSITTSRGGSTTTSPVGVAQTHRVSRGETLYSIAFQHDLDFRALALANALNPPYTIYVDQELNLDVNNPTTSGAVSRNSTLGTAVPNNSVARAQGTASRSSEVIRQPIGGSSDEPTNWLWPHSGRVLRGFENGQNKGIDIDGRLGDPVYASGGGDVVYSGRGIQGAGELIIIRHSDRYLSAYAHNSSMQVREGDRVEAGQQIAEVGPGPAGNPMLHFEIRVDGKSVDPTGLLPRQ